MFIYYSNVASHHDVKKRQKILHLSEAVRETRPNKKIDFRFNFFYVFFLEAHLKRSQTVNFEKLKISTSSWTSVEMPKNDNF